MLKLLNSRTPERVIFQKGFLESNNNLGDQKVKKQLVSACKMTSFHARPPSKSTEDSNPADPARDIDKTIPTLKKCEKCILHKVGDIALHIILSKLRAEDSARAACVSTKLRASASDESFWSLFCARDLHLSQPLDPLGNFAPSFKYM
ncbi:hypothetical protein C1H46_042134 [Malus baccata]|uniref:F-box domain-containing protein n=1 Tax=Malus baccata TaxID=106549 RepID=A0A540KDM7_MALBA|nr:hypothetical protein C1H46_042134 [Malus baccata]